MNNAEICTLLKMAHDALSLSSKREWVGLTDEEVLALWGRNFTVMGGKGWLELYRMAEAKLKEKNK